MSILNHPALEELRQKATAARKEGLNRSRQLAEITRLKLNNHGEEEAIKRAYMELGKLYYAEHGTAPEGAYVALCSQISRANDAIQANLTQIALLRKTTVVTEADFVDDAPEVMAEEPASSAEEPLAEPVLTAEEAPAEEESIPDEE